jgi:signal peptidase II
MTCRFPDLVKRLFPVLLIVFVLCSCVGCDQLAKDFARDRIRSSGPVTLLGDALHLVYTENSGVAFGVGSGLPDEIRFWIFVVGISLVLVGIAAVAYMRRRQGLLYLTGAALLVGGGASNLVDRLTNDGHVVDFLMISLGGLRTAVFNVADVLVLAGAVTVVVSAFLSQKRMAAPPAYEAAA